MEHQVLRELYAQQMQELQEVRETAYGQFVEEVQTLAGQIGLAYRFGNVFAPALYPEKCLEKLSPGDKMVSAVGHYQGRAHATLSEVALMRARRLHRQNRSPEDYAALQVAIYLLRSVVNTRADMARLEAYAGKGPFASSEPDVQSLRQVEERLYRSCGELRALLSVCDQPSDVVTALLPTVTAEFAQSQKRVRTALNKAEVRAKPQGDPRRLAQISACRKALTEMENIAKRADTKAAASVGEVVQKYYGIVHHYPWYFDLPNPASKPAQKPANQTGNQAGNQAAPTVPQTSEQGAQDA